MDSFTRRDSFVQQLFAQNRRRKRLFSLLYDGKLLTSDTLNFRESVSRKELWEEREIVYDIDPGKLVLRLNMRIYRTFPIIECLPWLEYSGSEPGGLIEEFHSLDLLEDLPPQNLVMPDWQDGTRPLQSRLLRRHQ